MTYFSETGEKFEPRQMLSALLPKEEENCVEGILVECKVGIPHWCWVLTLHPPTDQSLGG